MKQMLFLSKSAVLALLEQAFDEGWNGYYDLKSSTAERLLEEYLESKQIGAEPTPEPTFTVGPEPDPGCNYENEILTSGLDMVHSDAEWQPDVETRRPGAATITEVELVIDRAPTATGTVTVTTS